VTTDIELLENFPLAPAAPAPLYFNTVERAWILSTYDDVRAALRSPFLSQARPPRQGRLKERTSAQPAKHSGFDSGFELRAAAGWEIKTKYDARLLLKDLHDSREIDLVKEFIRPWCLRAALLLTGTGPEHGPYLASLVDDLCESDAQPFDPFLRTRAQEANLQLDAFFHAQATGLLKSLFLGVAQTVPAFLGSAWAALLQNPDQRTELQIHPERMTNAVEEFLRYAGPVHTLFRQANADLDLSGTNIACGDMLLLRVSSANRDPQRFDDANQLTVTRDVRGHLALSGGLHHCRGASIVRVMTAIATQSLLEQPWIPEICDGVGWSCGTMLMWPSSLRVILRGVY